MRSLLILTVIVFLLALFGPGQVSRYTKAASQTKVARYSESMLATIEIKQSTGASNPKQELQDGVEEIQRQISIASQ